MRLALMVLLAAPVLCPAQSVEGPGDNVLCSGYPAPHLWTANDLRGPFRLPPPGIAVAVTGKPYSARQVMQDMQIRADGTEVCNPPGVTVLYRDSEGRTRRETSLNLQGPDGKPTPSRVNIVDPVGQVEYYFDVPSHVAYRLHPRQLSEILQGLRGVPGSVVHPAVKSLGTHPFEGVDVEGALGTTTVTVPGSAPYRTTQEVWTWPYLPMVVLNKIVTPSSRRTIADLQLSSAEPDPALFRVPDGWKIVEGVPASPGGADERNTTAGYQYTAHIAPPLRSDLVVKNAPYAAEQTSEIVSNLAGPALPMVNLATKIYRDSHGRTRVERPVIPQTMGDKLPPPVFPEITDPVGAVRIDLDPIHRIAYRFALPEPSANPLTHGRYDGHHPNSTETGEDLGEKTIEGLSVEGTFETFRTPAGSNGNDREITETSEDWFSPELQVEVLSKQSWVAQNSTMKLTNITTGEPNPTLFEIPPGYTVVDAKATVTIIVTQP